MGAIVSVINEEMCRPLDGTDIQNNSGVEIKDVIRLRELLHIVYKDEDDLDDSALTPELALEIDTLMTKCALEPGLGRLASDDLLRDLLRQQMSELSPTLEVTQSPVHQESKSNGKSGSSSSNNASTADEGSKSPGSQEREKQKKKADIASLARIHAQNRRFEKPDQGTAIIPEEHGSIVVNHDNDITPVASNASMAQNFPADHNEYKSMMSSRLPMITDDPLEHSIASSIASSKRGSISNRSEIYSKTESKEEDAASVRSAGSDLNRSIKSDGIDTPLSDNPAVAIPTPVAEQEENAVTPVAKSGMAGRRRPSQLAFDIKDDNSAGVPPPTSTTSPISTTPSQATTRRRPTLLQLQPEEDLTSNAPLNIESPANEQGLELRCAFDSGPNTNGGNNGSGNMPGGNNGGRNGGGSHQSTDYHQISEDSDVCHLSRSGTLIVDDFHIGVEGIMDSPTGRFGKNASFRKEGEQGNHSSSNSNGEEVKSPGGISNANDSNDGEKSVGFEVGEGGVGGANVIRRPSKTKRRPSLNRSSAGATGEPFLELQRLGAGASGTVVKAIHVASLRLVAIKTLPIFDAAKRHQMIRELKLLYRWQMETIKGSSTHDSLMRDSGISALNGDDGNDVNTTLKEEEEEEHHSVSHCHEIVSFHDAFISPANGSVSLVVEYMNGGSLQDLADQGGCPDEAFLASVASNTLRGLKFLHTSNPRKIHRDIKPANILINTRGECKIADFGIYREMDAAGSANAHTFIGSLSFMSPERIRGDEYGCPADVWSIGLTLMTVALGRCPVTDNGRGYWALLHELTDKPPPTLPEDKPFSPLIRDFLSKLLTADPALRWSAVQLLAHPFMHEHGFGEDSPIYTPNPATNSSSPASTNQNGVSSSSEETVAVTELQVNELNQVIEVLVKRTHEIMAANVYNMANPEPFPLISEDKLARFSEQIDMPVSMVREAFEKKFNGDELPRILL